MNDVVQGCRVEGEVTLDGTEDIYDRESSIVVKLRARVGMVFQKPNPFPKSIYENVAYGRANPRHRGPSRADLDDLVTAEPAQGGPGS